MHAFHRLPGVLPLHPLLAHTCTCEQVHSSTYLTFCMALHQTALQAQQLACPLCLPPDCLCDCQDGHPSLKLYLMQGSTLC